MIFRFFGFLTFYIFFNILIFCANAAIFWKEKRRLRSKGKGEKLWCFIWFLWIKNLPLSWILSKIENLQVPACKMKPSSTCILQCGTPSWACFYKNQIIWLSLKCSRLLKISAFLLKLRTMPNQPQMFFLLNFALISMYFLH